MREIKHNTLLNESDIIEAKRLFMDFVPVTDIAKRLNLNKNTLFNYVRQYWKEERAIFAAELIHEIADSKKGQLVQISGLTADLLMSSLQALTDRENPLSLREARDATAIYEVLDKILKLDAGQPTDIVASEKPATIVEIQARIDKDPFKSTELVDFKEVDESEEEVNINKLRKKVTGETK